MSASIRRLDWGPNVVAAAAPWWIEQVAYGLATEVALGPERALRVRYEDIVLHPREAIRQVTEFLGMDFDPGMLAATGFGPPVFTESQHALVGRPPDRTRVDAWQSSLSDREVEIFEYLTCDLLSFLGYEPWLGARAERPSLAERIGHALEDLAGRCLNKLRRSRRMRQARRRIATDDAAPRREHATGSRPSPTSSGEQAAAYS